MAIYKVVAMFVLAYFLLLSTRISTDAQELLPVAAAEGGAKAPSTPAPAPAPAPAPSPAPAPAPGLVPYIIINANECGGACKERCKLHSRQNVCGRACMTCCRVCKCVPPGTYGHTELCGKCYTDWKTHGNRTKCP